MVKPISKLFLLLLSFFTIQLNAQSLDSLISFPEDHEFYSYHKIDSFEYSLSSPYHTFHTLYDFLDEDNFHPGIAARVFNKNIGSIEKRQQLAEDLKLILSAKGIYPHNTNVSLLKNYVDKKTNKRRFTITDKYPDIYLIKYSDGNWYFSRYTSERIPYIFNEIYPGISRKIIEFVLKIKQNNNQLLGKDTWQITSLFSLILMLVIVGYLLNYLLKFATLKITNPDYKSFILDRIINHFIKPVNYAILLYMFNWLLPLFLIDSDLSYYLSTVVRVLLGIAILLILYRSVDIIVYQMYHKTKYNRLNFNENLSPIVKTSMRIFAVLIGIGIFFNMLGYDITNFIAGLSFGGIVIAFAAQDTVKNFIGSIMLFADQPFRVGDYIEIDNLSGVVEEIGFRSTKVRTFEDSVMVFPNSLLSDNRVDNKGMRNSRRFRTLISITYNTPRTKIIKFTNEIREIIKNHPLSKPDAYYVHLNEFGPSSLDLLFQMYICTNERIIELQAREEIMLEIIRLSEEIGVEFAFPTQTVYFNNEDEINNDTEKGIT
ncbi:mechanosensitive ion channel family protein [Flammeovirga agarivorans]|uniref:Mechanosensitive ion channel family protein n=1 Tax=Flammeovirga agarivorans TaxID=2726742 RepID=A0A7X8SLV7_9BACT|nr:mechanosensitive ion channel family protein [Flammeovirga agarivorans]NLR92619.1 mechanosensitive ion channel family protein [Flammeovirga agarivorans]